MCRGLSSSASASISARCTRLRLDAPGWTPASCATIPVQGWMVIERPRPLRVWLRFRSRQGDHNAPAARYCPLGYHRNASESGLRPATGRSADKDAARPEGSVQAADTRARIQVVTKVVQRKFLYRPILHSRCDDTCSLLPVSASLLTG